MCEVTLKCSTLTVRSGILPPDTVYRTTAHGDLKYFIIACSVILDLCNSTLLQVSPLGGSAGRQPQSEDQQEQDGDDLGESAQRETPDSSKVRASRISSGECFSSCPMLMMSIIF